MSSPTWQFHVRARSAPVDTSWGLSPDINGDGFDDVLVGANLSNEVLVYLGSPAGPSPSPSMLPDPGGMGGLEHVIAIGDMNGDGFADVAVADDDSSTVFVYLGGPNGLSATPWTSLLIAPTSLSLKVSGVGDVNGDGYADLIVGWSDGILLYTGAPLASDISMTTLSSPSTQVQILGLIGSAGDINGDGFADVMLVNNNDKVAAYFGSASGLLTTPPVVLSKGGNAAGVGDVNGDGFADVVTSAPDGIAYLYLGGLTGPQLPTPLSVNTMGSSLDIDGYLTAVGDVNGDGFDDITLATANTEPVLFWGSTTGLTNLHTIPLSVDMVEAAEDINGDGFSDMIFFPNPTQPSMPSSLAWSAGSPTGPDLTPRVLSDPGVNGFGSSVASAFP